MQALLRWGIWSSFMAALFIFAGTGKWSCLVTSDTLRDCQQENAGTCYNTVVSPIYFVSFVLTAQFVLVNVVIAVLMKHLEESNKEAKEEAELEAELQLELQHGGGGGSGRSPQLSPLDLGMEVGGPGVSPWRSPEREIQRRASVMVDSPQADITTRDTSSDPLLVLEPPLEMEILDPGEPLEDNLLSVRKSTVGRTHSLPNDSYMFLPLEPFGSPGAGLGPGLASQTQTTGPQHIETINKALSGSCTSLRTQPDDRPSSPHSLSHSQSIHTLSRTLRRQ
ncbi:voltage-dependent T-type calcium channel subunit alpha-1G-like, partial [Salvelinus sp. IW2-2015]|uniref:voltage-dependent T-type calcium channel subunit alpha-1G-like n=1 Tax=Salvelinus sp. IW2-2015 TaxID=2691554 RepID=UPI000CEA7BE8